MILLFNVYITNTAGNQFFQHNRGNLPLHKKIDVTKYSLASLAVTYPWTKAIINVEFDPNHTTQEVDEFEQFVRKEYDGIDLTYSRQRCERQSEWQSLYAEFTDDLILYLGNHDHVFIDSSNDHLQELIDVAKSTYPSTATIAISHWPENIRWAQCGYIELNQVLPKEPFKDYSVSNDHLHFKTVSVDSIIVLTKQLYYDWFFTGSWGDLSLPRTDGIGGASIPTIRQALRVPLPQQDIIVPLKEQFRHFDGYTHQLIDNNTCPSISIPPGFFDHNIRIRYGYTDRKEGWVNLNPTLNYFAFDITGADDRITLDDIPLFWKDRIAEIDVNPSLHQDDMIQHRLHGVLQMMYSDERYSPYIEDRVEQNVLNTYLKTYKGYGLSL